MTQVFGLHSAYGLVTAVAAMDSGVIPMGERVLLTMNTTAVPETSSELRDSAHLHSLVARFDRVISLNDVLDPLLPTAWRPAESERPMIARLLRASWGLGTEPVELFLQSPQVAPARTLLSLFEEASTTIIGDGLMTYSPLRNEIPRRELGRVVDVVYADVVPGVEPLLIPSAQRRPISPEALRAVFAEIAQAVQDPDLDRLAASDTPTALVLGQYLAALGLITNDEETAMQCEMIDRARGWGVERIVFKPHPSAPPALTDAVAAYAASQSLDLEVYSEDVPAEIVAARLDVAGVVAGFSTSLPTVHALSGTPIASVGNAELLARLQPFPNSNRVPIVIVDALTREDSPYTAPGSLAHLVDAVGFLMQPNMMAHLRPRAESLLELLSDKERDRYFPAQVRAGVGLEGKSGGKSAKRRTASRAEQLALAARGARRRARRAWREVRGW